MSRPSLRQLAYFSAVAETGNFGRAARRFGISQPSLSAQIQKLEETLGLTLVERGRKSVLTPAGRDMLQHARQIQAHMDALAEHARGLRAGSIGGFSLGSSPTIGPYLLPLVAAELRDRKQNISLVVHEATPEELVAGCIDGAYDAVLTQLPTRSDALIVRRLFRESLCLLVPRDHTLALRGEIAPTDLGGQNVLTLGPGYALHNQTSRICEASGAVLRGDYLGTSLDALRQMTAQGLGVAILPEIYASIQIGADDPSVAVVPFRDRPFWRSIGLVHRASLVETDIVERLAGSIRTIAGSRYGSHIAVEG